MYRDISLSLKRITIISMKKWFEGQARSLIYKFGTTKTHHPKFLIVVDEDIDIKNPEQISWALTNRCRPDEDIIIKSGIPATALDPSNTTHTRNTTSSSMGFDATKPLPPLAKRHEWIVSTIPFQKKKVVGTQKARGGEELRHLTEEMMRLLEERSMLFYDILKILEKFEYRSVLIAMTKLYEENKIIQNDLGEWQLR